MCIIVYKPIGTKLDKNILKNCYDNNSHGSGYMYTENGKIIIDKGMDSFKKIYRRYKTAVIDTHKEKSIATVWHFRIKTHGKVDNKNCHPFYINNGHNQAFCHNGTIRNIDVPDKSELSDTVIFRDRILNHLPINWQKNPGIKLLMANFIQKTSKLLFLSKDGDVKIVNINLGEWEEGIWYSNTSYKSKPYTYNWNKRDEENHFGYNSPGIGAGAYSESLLPYRIDSSGISRSGYTKGEIWDASVVKYVKPWEHSNIETRKKAMANIHIMECFPKYKGPERKLLTSNDKTSYGNLSLAQLANIKRNYESSAYCWQCGIEIYTDREKKENKCFYCGTIEWSLGRNERTLH